MPLLSAFGQGFAYTAGSALAAWLLGELFAEE